MVINRLALSLMEEQSLETFKFLQTWVPKPMLIAHQIAYSPYNRLCKIPGTLTVLLQVALFLSQETRHSSTNWRTHLTTCQAFSWRLVPLLIRPSQMELPQQVQLFTLVEVTTQLFSTRQTVMFSQYPLTLMVNSILSSSDSATLLGTRLRNPESCWGATTSPLVILISHRPQFWLLISPVWVSRITCGTKLQIFFTRLTQPLPPTWSVTTTMAVFASWTTSALLTRICGIMDGHSRSNSLAPASILSSLLGLWLPMTQTVSAVSTSSILMTSITANQAVLSSVLCSCSSMRLCGLMTWQQNQLLCKCTCLTVARFTTPTSVATL